MTHSKIFYSTLSLLCAVSLLAEPAPQKQLIEGNNRFALDLYSVLSSEEGNLFFSPYSISTALSMAYVGARGNTEKEMRETLNYQLTSEEIAKAFADYDKGLQDAQKIGGYELAIANSIWGQAGHNFLESYLEVLENSFRAPLRVADFRTQAERAAEMINSWVMDKTNDRIRNLIAPGVLTPLTRMVLCNAIYFKGDWTSQFDEKNTRERPFLLRNDQEVDAPLMYQKLECLYGQTEAVKAIQLSYVGNDVSMLVILPKERGALSKIEAKLDMAKLEEITKFMHRREVEIYLPKFKMESKFSMSATLTAMGIKDAFSDAADFSGIDGTKDLLISAVIHKAFVEVNEEGTEAAAATGLIAGVTSYVPLVPLTFRADHPFLFIIRENAGGGILFMGRVADPRS